MSNPSTLNYHADDRCIDPVTGQQIVAGTTVNDVTFNSKTNSSTIEGHNDSNICVHEAENNGTVKFGAETQVILLLL